MKKVGLIHLEMVKEKEICYEGKMEDSSALYGLAKKFYQNDDRERVYVCGVDATHTLVYVEMVAQGQLDRCELSLRELFKALVLSNCAAFFIWHNHTSLAKLEPSDADRIFTMRIKKAGKLMGIELLDHLVINGEEFISIIKGMEKKEE